MSVLVCFHAHPDDEVFTTGGTMRLAADAGHRVVLVTATDGALGEVPAGLLTPGQTLAERRLAELQESAAVLGAHRVVAFGYADSGMAGTPANDAPAAFWRVDTEVAAARLAAVLTEEHADVLTIYDDHGNYGHPDHIAIHRVGLRAAEIAAIPHVYEATVNRDAMMAVLAARDAAVAEAAGADEVRPADPADTEPAESPGDLSQFGLPAAEITTTVDVSGVIAAKRAAMVAHATQVGDFGPFLGMDLEDLRRAFGREWFRRHDAPPGLQESGLPL